MIKQIRIQNYKALRDVTLDLTPIHVLIGPNDSGKTSILEAIAALCRSVEGPLLNAFPRMWNGCDLVWQRRPDHHVAISCALEFESKPMRYDLSVGFVPQGRGPQVVREELQVGPPTSRTLGFGRRDNDTSVFRLGTRRDGGSGDENAAAQLLSRALQGMRSFRWDPRILAFPVALGHPGERFQLDPSGFGLALCLDSLLGYNRKHFDKLEESLTTIFRHLEAIVIVPDAGYPTAPREREDIYNNISRPPGKGLYFRVKGSAIELPAAQMSDGFLLILAYLTVLNLPTPPPVLLIEEPENGIHPKRLQEVISILRTLIEQHPETQVVMTTHSPYLLDLFQPNEVTLCRREADGSVAVTRLDRNPIVRKQLDLFTLGEIWTSEGDEALAQADAPSEVPKS